MRSKNPNSAARDARANIIILPFPVGAAFATRPQTLWHNFAEGAVTGITLRYISLLIPVAKRRQQVGRPRKPTPRQRVEARRRPAEGATFAELAPVATSAWREFSHF